MTTLHWFKAALLAAFLAVSSLALAANDPQQAVEQAVLLDINSADAATIAAALDGIGLAKAQEIVAYREMFGKFQSVEELAEVKCIGAATIEKNRDRIVIVKN
ncbi:MAG: competence protein ComEA [Gammaproteobacteria bacterium]|nr:competence protein ComEA [Gammaproteobacteria bacterium]